MAVIDMQVKIYRRAGASVKAFEQWVRGRTYVTELARVFPGEEPESKLGRLYMAKVTVVIGDNNAEADAKTQAAVEEVLAACRTSTLCENAYPAPIRRLSRKTSK